MKINTHRSSHYRNLLDLFIGEIIFLFISFPARLLYIEANHKISLINARDIWFFKIIQNHSSNFFKHFSTNSHANGESISDTFEIECTRPISKINRIVESNLFKHSQTTKFTCTCTYSQYQFGFVLDSIRYNRAIGIPFTILSTALNKRKQTRVQRYRIEFSRSHVSLDRRRRRRADNCRCLDNKSVSIINRR